MYTFTRKQEVFQREMKLMQLCLILELGDQQKQRASCTKQIQIRKMKLGVLRKKPIFADGKHSLVHNPCVEKDLVGKDHYHDHPCS